jgi:uncharacterized protein
MNKTNESPALPWWRYGHVWLVVLGPVVVVVASLVTGAVAMKGADVVMDHPSQVSGTERGLVPAHQARNHAATPNESVPVRLAPVK